LFLNNKYYIYEYYSEMFLKEPRVQMSTFVKKKGHSKEDIADLRFSKSCFWGFTSSGLWCHVVG